MTTTAHPIPRILVVHEDPAQGRLLREVFALLGLAGEVEQARDAATAMRLCADPARRPALVLLGLMLAHHRGDRLLSHLRSVPALAAIPVIVITVAPRAIDADRSAMLGAECYLELPMDIGSCAELVARCRELLALRDDLEEIGAPPAPMVGTASAG
jgi:DNA-binding response OmpR family regulator